MQRNKNISLSEEKILRKPWVAISRTYVLDKYWLAFSWLIYLFIFYLTEQFVSETNCFVVHHPLDDIIPFNKYFVVFYFLWHFMLAGTLLYYFSKEEPLFKKMQMSLILIQVFCLSVYCILPSMQDLRPTITDTDVFSSVITWLYSYDTPTGVCPSQHVTHSIVMAYFAAQSKKLGKTPKVLIVFACFMIILSVMFIKQHSVIDVMAAVPVALCAVTIIEYLFKKEYLV